MGIGDAVMDCVTHHTPDVLAGEQGGCEVVSAEDLALLYSSLQGSAWQMCALNFMQPPSQRIHVDLTPFLRVQSTWRQCSKCDARLEQPGRRGKPKSHFSGTCGERCGWQVSDSRSKAVHTLSGSFTALVQTVAAGWPGSTPSSWRRQTCMRA